MNYGVSSRDYLARAKRCLAHTDISHLFYAAFEIRCGAEARMQEYLEAQEHISNKMRQGWKIAKLANNIESTFKLGDKVAILRIRNKHTHGIEYETKYTPITASLRKRVEKYGNYLHSAKSYHSPNDEYWRVFRADLEMAVKELEVANSGRLLGPILLHPDKKHCHVNMEMLPQEEQDIVSRFSVGTEGVMEISYE